MLGTSEGLKEAESITVCQTQTQELALTTKIKNHPWVRDLVKSKAQLPLLSSCLLLASHGRTYQKAAVKGTCLRVWATPQRGEENSGLGLGLGLKDAPKHNSITRSMADRTE